MFRGQRLWEVGVDRCRKELTIFQRIIQCIEIEYLSASRIDDDGTLRQSSQLLRSDHSSRFRRQLGYQHEELAFRQHRMKVFHKLRINQASNSWVDIRIVCKHAAVEPVFQLPSDLRADVAEPNDAYGFSL